MGWMFSRTHAQTDGRSHERATAAAASTGGEQVRRLRLAWAQLAGWLACSTSQPAAAGGGGAGQTRAPPLLILSSPASTPLWSSQHWRACGRSFHSHSLALLHSWRPLGRPDSRRTRKPSFGASWAANSWLAPSLGATVLLPPQPNSGAGVSAARLAYADAAATAAATTTTPDSS